MGAVTTGAGGVPVASTDVTVEAGTAGVRADPPAKIVDLFGRLNMIATAHQVGVVESWAADHGISL